MGVGGWAGGEQYESTLLVSFPYFVYFQARVERFCSFFTVHGKLKTMLLYIYICFTVVGEKGGKRIGKRDKDSNSALRNHSIRGIRITVKKKKKSRSI